MPQTQHTPNKHTMFRMPEPSFYHVLFHNDDTTTMDFVVMVLKSIFRKSQPEAENLMMKVHTEGSAIAGTYSLDIAESKVKKTHKLARANGFPLELTIEEA